MGTLEYASGIDVSHYKKRIDWIQVEKSGVQFAIIKATEADNFIDPRFDYNWTRTRREGIIRGAYHFFRPLVDPVRQANNFIKVAGRTLHRNDLPPVLDIESYPDFVAREWKQISLDERLRRIQIWLQTVETATGRVPIIYTEYYSWRDFIGNTEKFVRNPLWIANYRVDSPKVPANNWGGKGWTLWQTTEKGIVPGIREEAACVDQDVFRGTLQDLKTWLKIETPRALPPNVTNGDMMAALVDAADMLGTSSDELVKRACLHYLVDPIGNSLRPYDGPTVEDLPISSKEKRKLAQVLEKFEGQNSSAWCITHQDLINAFYSIGSMNGTGGWTLVERVGLNYIGEDRAALYDGPVIENLPGLTDEQRLALSDALGLIPVTEVAEEVTEREIPPLEEVEGEPVEEPHQEAGLTENVVDELEEAEQIEEVEISPAPVQEEQVEPETPQESGFGNSYGTYGNQVDNQAIINAFYLAAITLDLNGRDLIVSAGLAGLVDNRLEIYSGPRLEELPGLSRTQREKIAELIGIKLNPALLPIESFDPPAQQEEAPSSVETPRQEIPEPTTQPVDQPEDREVVTVTHPVVSPTYPGLVNQDLINLFYRVAAAFGENGWHWIVRCGLSAIGATRKTRFEDYQGPYIKSIPGLTQDQVEFMERELNQLKYA